MTICRPTRSLPAIVLVTLFIPAALPAQPSGATPGAEEIFDAIGVREGVTVCEIGAGDGALSLAAARIVGTGGRVYTSELGESRLASLKEKVSESGFAHLTVVAGDPAKTNFPAAGCDALFMRNVYHHFADPGTMNASIAASLKAGGRAAIVDFTPPGAEATDAAARDEDGMHGVSPESVSRELKDAGLEPVSTQRGGGRWFMVVAAKPGTARVRKKTSASITSRRRS